MLHFAIRSLFAKTNKCCSVDTIIEYASVVYFLWETKIKEWDLLLKNSFYVNFIFIDFLMEMCNSCIFYAEDQVNITEITTQD